MKNEETKEKKTASKGKTMTEKAQVKREGTKGDTSKAKQAKVENNQKKEIKKEEKRVILEETTVKEEKTKEVTKKKNSVNDLLLVLGLIIVVILGFMVMKGEKVEPTYELPLTLSGETGLHQLTYQEYQEKIDNNESFVVIIERATCSHCVNFMPVAEEFATNNNVPMYYVDTDTFSEEDWASFEKSNTFLKKNSNSWGTPTTVVLAGKEAVDYIEGETTADNLLKIYEEYFNMNNE